jgi:hypothetical protein
VGRLVLVQEDQVRHRVDARTQQLQAGRLAPAIPGVGIVGGAQAAGAGLPEQLGNTFGQARQQEVVAGVHQPAAAQDRLVLRGPQGELQRSPLEGGHLTRPAGGLVGEDQGEGRASPGPPPDALAAHAPPGDLLVQLPPVGVVAQLGQQVRLRAQAGQAAGHDPPRPGQFAAPGADQHFAAPLQRGALVDVVEVQVGGDQHRRFGPSNGGERVQQGPRYVGHVSVPAAPRAPMAGQRSQRSWRG